MLFKNIGLVDENFEYQPNMFVGIKGKTIDYIGSEEPTNAKDFGEVYDGAGKVLMPGFYNAHGHSPMTLMRGYGENLPLDRWLNELVFPFEDQLYDKGVYWATLLAMAESIRYGIVSTSDMYFFMDAMVRAISTSGTKSNLCRSISHFDDSDPRESYRFVEMRQGIEMYHGWDEGRILMDACPHSEYTNTEPMVRAIAEFAKEYDVRVQVHLAETEFETKGCIERHGVTPVKFMEQCGLFDQPTNAAHCVWVNDEDIEILKKHNVTVSTNPISNLKLASGICPVQKLYDAGINVAIGTDSVTSNNNLNFFEELKMFALLGKVKTGDAAAITPKQVLYSATRAGALSQGREDCGLVKEGFKADLIVVDISEPNMQPIHNVVNNLVYSTDGKDVCLTMVDGNVLYQDGEYKTIDVEQAIAETEKAKNKMLAGVAAAKNK